MQQEGQAGLLQEEIETVLSSLSGTGGFLAEIQEAVTHTSQGISANKGHDLPWSLLPLIICEAICGQSERALPTAAAVVFFKTAADVFDDIEDADAPDSLSSKCGAAVATNVATALLFIAEKALLRLKERGVDDADIVRVIDVINSYYLRACAGQHSDIMSSADASLSEERYLEIIEVKTALQLQCSCHAGAILGNGSSELIDIFTDTGRCLGMAAQIANDIRGVTTGNDIMARKISLPVIYALANTNGRAREPIEVMFGKKRDVVTCADEIKEMLFQTGAIQYAMIKMETYRQEGLKRLLEARKMGARVERLEPFFK
ncbi:MAG: polyprenyl synthetase family protein [Dehalococcoidales bacterium]|nr:polyprenyl synthetase family protein [Dehalococcoidales bacterium]